MTRGRSIRALIRNNGPVRWIPVYEDAASGAVQLLPDPFFNTDESLWAPLDTETITYISDPPFDSHIKVDIPEGGSDTGLYWNGAGFEVEQGSILIAHVQIGSFDGQDVDVTFQLGYGSVGDCDTFTASASVLHKTFTFVVPWDVTVSPGFFLDTGGEERSVVIYSASIVKISVAESDA